ncbi:MAG: CPBP family intramembrane glutamic endopeptidase [Actinomycetota bacterium]
MSPIRSTVAAIIGGYNLVQNLVLPTSMYVPANVVVSAGLLSLARRSGCSWDDLGLDPRQAKAGVRLGLVASGAVVAGAAGTLSHPSLRRHLLDRRAANQERGDVLFHTLARFPLGTALFEEVAFRGVVEGIWRRSGATEREAALAAAALFGLWHLIPTRDAMEGSPLAETLRSETSRAGAVLAGAVATAIASLGFSWLRKRSGSLFAPWLAHTAVSCGGYLAGVVAWRRHGDLPTTA